ncbi:MAG: FG-GAP-like repeat-containing protein [Lentisphaerales bacterium]|nr:FG-GAP-like repeat-containing protein [Lentisphaerales bacterium]
MISLIKDGLKLLGIKKKDLTQRRRGAEGNAGSPAFQCGLKYAFLITLYIFQQTAYSQEKYQAHDECCQSTPCSKGLVQQFSIENPQGTLEKSYIAQQALVKEEIEIIGGFKGGAVSAGAKKWFKVTNPMAAVLPKSGWIDAVKPVTLAYKANRMIELEVGFIIGSDISSHISTIEELKSKVKSIVPLVELPVNRVEKKGKLEFIDFIAANVGADQYLVGQAFPEGVEADSLNISLFKDNEELTRAVGSVADGGQWANVLFQVNHAVQQGYKVKQGQLIITGSLGKIKPADAGNYTVLYEGYSEIKFSVKNKSKFTAREIYKGTRVNSAQAHDYNGDGLKDVVFVADKKLYLATAPAYKPQAVYDYSVKFCGDSLHNQIMDVDGDGDMDFVGCSFGLYWIECPDNPLDSWTFHKISSASNGIHCILIHDVDGDGNKDIVVNNYLPKEKYGESIIWYRVPANPKKDKWQALLIADRTAPGGVHYMSMGDIDGDGVEEFLAGAKGENFKNGNWFAYWERGDDVNKPWKRVTIPGIYEGATHIYPADVNMDGKMDLVTSQGHNKGIHWFEGPDFKAHKIDEKLIHPHAMQVADMDNDGDIDVVACANYSAKVQWFENDGKGNFTRHHLLNNQQSYDISISDLNNDNKKDIIIAGWKGGNVMILINN